MIQQSVYVNRQPDGRFIATISMDGKTHNGEGVSIGQALMVLGDYLLSLEEAEPKDQDLHTLMGILRG